MKAAGAKKAPAPKGTRTQRLFTFRLDDENADWLYSQVNRGRYINDLIKADREKQ